MLFQIVLVVSHCNSKILLYIMDFILYLVFSVIFAVEGGRWSSEDTRSKGHNGAGL